MTARWGHRVPTGVVWNCGTSSSDKFAVKMWQGNAVVCDWLLWSVAGWTITLGVVLIQRAVIGAAMNPSRRHYNTSYWPKFKYRFFFLTQLEVGQNARLQFGFPHLCWEHKGPCVRRSPWKPETLSILVVFPKEKVEKWGWLNAWGAALSQGQPTSSSHNQDWRELRFLGRNHMYFNWVSMELCLLAH